MGFVETLKLLLWVVFIDCIGVGLLISTLMWWGQKHNTFSWNITRHNDFFFLASLCLFCCVYACFLGSSLINISWSIAVKIMMWSGATLLMYIWTLSTLFWSSYIFYSCSLSTVSSPFIIWIHTHGHSVQWCMWLTDHICLNRHCGHKLRMVPGIFCGQYTVAYCYRLLHIHHIPWL